MKNRNFLRILLMALLAVVGLTACSDNEPDVPVFVENARILENGEKEERFEAVFIDGSQMKDSGMRQILVDRETGVNYLVWNSGNAGGITPLLDSEGKVVIRK